MTQIDSIGNTVVVCNVGVSDFVVDMDANGNIGIAVFGIEEAIHMRKATDVTRMVVLVHLREDTEAFNRTFAETSLRGNKCKRNISKHWQDLIQ